MNDNALGITSYRNACQHHFLKRCSLYLSMLLLATVLASSTCRADDKSLVIPAVQADWRFFNPAVKFEIKQDYERNYDSPFAGKPKLIWQGRGVADQTVVHELEGDAGDFSGYGEISVWLCVEVVGGRTSTEQELFKTGSGDGNIHLLLQDQDEKTAYAFFQDQYKPLGKWCKLTASLAGEFQGLNKLDLQHIQRIGVGLNIVNSEDNRRLSYNVSFAELELSEKRTLSPTQSRIHPGQYLPYQKACVLKDYPSGFHIAMAADKEQLKQIKDPVTLEIDLPKDLRFDAISGHFIGWDIIEPSVPEKYFNFPQMEDWRDREVNYATQDIMKDGRQFVRYSIPLDKAAVIKNLREKLEGRFSSGVELYISGGTSSPDTGHISWRCTGIGLDWQSIDYEILERLPQGQAPRRLTTVVWCGMELIPEELWPQMIELYKAGGFNTYINSGWLSPRIKRMHALLQEKGIKTYQAGQPAVYASWFSGDPEDKSLWAYTEDGKINPWGVACLTYCAENGEKFREALEPFYRQAAEYYPVYGLVNDLELQGTTKLCYHCPRCQKAFAEYASLDVATLTPELIQEQYQEMFKQFHLEQNGKIARNWVSLIRQINPDLEAILCSGHIPHGEESADRYIEHSGTDPRLWDDVVDQHWPMMYFNGYPLARDVETTTDALNKPVVPLLGSGFYVGVKKFTPEQTELNVLACLLEGARGYGFYIGFVSWDARYWDKLARLSHLAAGIEDVLLDGHDVSEKAPLCGISPEDKCIVKVYKNADRIILGVINYSENRISPEIDLSIVAPHVGQMRELYRKGAEDKDVLLEGTTLKMSLDAENAAILLLTTER